MSETMIQCQKCLRVCNYKEFWAKPCNCQFKDGEKIFRQVDKAGAIIKGGHFGTAVIK